MGLKRVRKVYVILGMMLITEITGLFYNSGTVEGVNSRADKLKIYATAEREEATVIPGDIYDRNGEILAETQYKTVVDTAEDKTKTNSTVRFTNYKNALAYSQLLGYTGARELYPLAESADQVLGNRDDYRLMAFLDEDYWGENGIYHTVGADGIKGQSATLTIDDALQEKVFQALGKVADSSDDIASAVVMDAKTGEILAMVNFPAYDLNDLSSAKQKMTEDQERGLSPRYPVTYKQSVAPGSIFKILMATALIDHGMENFTVKNTSFVVDHSGYENLADWTCYASVYNSGTLRIGEDEKINLEHALNTSSNVYFAKAALELGEEALQETASKFMLKQGETYLSSDFGYIKYNWNPAESVLAETGIGQGYTELTTVYAAMIAQAIANDGKMMQPYLIRNLTDANGKKVYEGKPELLSKATSKSTANKVTSYLCSTAQEICQLHGLADEKVLFSKYKVAGKTGTAEVGENAEKNNAWYLSFAPADDPQYVIAVNQCQTKKLGYKMVPVAAEIYHYLFEEYEKS